MVEKLKAAILFHILLKRHNIEKAYAMVGPEDSWYDTISTVHNSLAEIKRLPYEDWKITSHDGLDLKALYYPCGSDKTVIWVHGYSSHAERESAFPGLFYRSLGFNVLVPYLRAHGPSGGKRISFGPLEGQDIMGWVNKVNETHPDGSILIHGLSMGGGIALDLATMELKNVKGMVADAPSVSIEKFFRNVASDVFRKDGEAVADEAIRRYRKVFRADPADYDRVTNIKNARYPLLLSAGSNENMEDVLMQIKQNAPTETTVLILPGCNHGNGMYKQTELYQAAIKAFIDKHF